jgi:hypothetical protein
MPRASVWLVRTALLHLGVGITFGALMLWNKGLPFAPALWTLYLPHIELLLFGWTVQAIMGVAFWIVPRFAKEPRYGRVRLVWGAMSCLNAGVLLMVVAYLLNSPPALLLVGRGLELLAVALFAAHVWPRIKPMSDVLPP